MRICLSCMRSNGLVYANVSVVYTTEAIQAGVDGRGCFQRHRSPTSAWDGWPLDGQAHCRRNQGSFVYASACNTLSFVYANNEVACPIYLVSCMRQNNVVCANVLVVYAIVRFNAVGLAPAHARGDHDVPLGGEGEGLHQGAHP